ncbi:MAG: hypothetical protein GY906_20555 [bacterium]|nr:hypothetical protein [bacterium]
MAVETSAMRRRTFGLVGAVILACLVVQGSGCRSSAPVQAEADRVVVFSIDGLGADMAREWLEEPIVRNPAGLPGYVKRGVFVRRLLPVDPTLTAVAHAAMATGQLPDQTGIVSNVFRWAGEPAGHPVSGFDFDFEPSTVSQFARGQGLQVGVIAWPGVDRNTPGREADFGVEWPASPVIGSTIEWLVADNAIENDRFPVNDGIVAKQWTVSIEFPGQDLQEFGVILYDGEKDERGRYDTVMVRGPEDGQWQPIDSFDWFPVHASGSHDSGHPQGFGAWCKVLELDRHRGSIQLYRGAFHGLQAYPEKLQSELEVNIGFWPGVPDDQMLREWWVDSTRGVDLETYLEQVIRLEEWLASARKFVIENHEFDLLLCASPTLDRFLHSNLLVDERQWTYSPGRAFAAREAGLKVTLTVHKAISELWTGLNQQADALVVVSSHGMAPVHDGIRAERLLVEAELALPVEDHAIGGLLPSSQVLVQASGPVAHIYLNLVGREPLGHVVEEESDELLRRAARAFADLEVDGEAVVERIVTNEEAAELSLSHPNSGDLIVFLNPGFSFLYGTVGPLVEATKFYGQHGYLSHHPEMHGVLFARGAGVKKRRVDEMPATDVSVMLRNLLQRAQN